jgi:hypothetical protein
MRQTCIKKLNRHRRPINLRVPYFSTVVVDKNVRSCWDTAGHLPPEEESEAWPGHSVRDPLLCVISLQIYWTRWDRVMAVVGIRTPYPPSGPCPCKQWPRSKRQGSCVLVVNTECNSSALRCPRVVSTRAYSGGSELGPQSKIYNSVRLLSTIVTDSLS